MQIYEHHVIFDEITYDREELKDWYKSVEQYKVDFATLTNKISSSGLSHNKKFSSNKQFQTLDTENQIGIPISDYKQIRCLIEKFNFETPLNKFDVDVLIYEPKYYFAPHVDFHMHCGIMFPILPDTGMAPIDFYRLPSGATWGKAKTYITNFERDHIYSYHYSLDHPSMFNGETIHGVRNNNNTRVFLRFKILHMTFQQVIDAGNQGKLFQKLF